MLTTGNGNTWENPLKGVIIDSTGIIQFSGITRGGIGDNSGEFLGNNSGILGNTDGLENENILFLKDELSRENSHEFIVDVLHWFGKSRELKSLEDIDLKYKDFNLTTGEIRDLLFELGVFDFCLNWDFATFKRCYYVFKGTRKMAGAVFDELAEKKKKSKDLPVEPVAEKNIAPTEIKKTGGAFGGKNGN